MDISQNTFKIQCCLGCLSNIENTLTNPYNIQSEILKTAFQMSTINLCYICKKVAQRSEQFIKNVQRNQSYLETFTSIPDIMIDTRQYCRPLISLSSVSQRSIVVLSDIDMEVPESVICDTHTKDVEIKSEFKRELSTEPSDEELIDDVDCQDSSIKGEKNVLEDLKEETESMSDDMSLSQLKKTVKKRKLKKKSKRLYQEKEKGMKIDKDPFITIINISREQCMKDRIEMRQDPKYINSIYKCEDCIKGFNFTETYERHMESHSKVNGEYECDICKRRMNSMEKLVSHKKYHEVRYKCSECGMTRLNRMTIKDHYKAMHLNDTLQHKCSLCNKLFNRQVSLKKHMANVHRRRERLDCKYCTKTFASKDGLNNHTMLKHPTQLSERSFKHNICEECGEAFKSPSQLKYHVTKHSDFKAFYCVECDRGFKSNYALKHHLKNAAAHVNYLELKLQCEHCDKKFGVTRELERHMNRVHLNRRPYQCDKCERAYLTMWSLSQHKRFTHEGHKRPLKYPCPLCDKVFAGSTTRKVHMRTHTGERPYACTKCAATFSQSAALATHNKLVHLRLTRDGQPKKQAASS
ncbi:zinc finger protein 91 [Bicyclus anynana]|uniref:Zinc finger protein 91 n=1 Tax=Bicyclus anynana TaxID=110368 RepID=A0A6J1N645_BICAN|nr:zinc finger protein 91 [Bicyclus anynana]